MLICEKMPDPGGISICSGGAVRCASDADDAFAYLKATNAGTTPDDVLRVLADGMAEAEAYVRRWSLGRGRSVQADRVFRKRGGNYPLPGWETFYHTQIDDPPDLDRRRDLSATCARGRARAGRDVLGDRQEHRRRGIDVRLNTPVMKLIRGPENEVRGVVLGGDGEGRRIAARRAVMLACGGFEANDEMQRQYWEGKPVLPASSRGNTGDGIRMAQALGAELWHMWHFHGSYAFKHPDPDFPFALRVKRLPDWNPAKKAEADVKMAWIVVDQHGRRYMNECPPYAQDTSHRPMHYLDAETRAFRASRRS